MHADIATCAHVQARFRMLEKFCDALIFICFVGADKFYIFSVCVICHVKATLLKMAFILFKPSN